MRGAQIPARRKRTKKLFIGDVPVGGLSPVCVQSMTKTDTRNVRATAAQIRALANAGCEIVRLAVPDMEAAHAFGRIKKGSRLPLVADIHFDWRLAVKAAELGADALRINPGNIGAKWKLREVVAALKDRGIPLRVGVNAGSLEKGLLKKFGHPTAEALVESAERNIGALGDMGFDNIKVSLKASNVRTTVEAYRLFSARFRFPLHIGISEAGPAFTGTVKSAVGLGILLAGGIGDTVRVSLTARPAEEVRVAYEILKSLGIRQRGPDIISCPTCGRCGIDLQGLVRDVQKRLKDVEDPITVAVMGCVVNGPGEAREADFGVAGGKGLGILFKKGRVLRKVKEERLLDELMKSIEKR